MELLFNKSPDGNIFAGGFSIKSLGVPSIISQSGGGTEDFSQTYAVPFGLVTTNFKPFHFQSGGGSDSNEVIADDLHKKLLELVREKRAKQSKTKKNHKSKKNITKRTYE